MKKKITETVTIPEGITVEIKGNMIKLSKGKDSVEKILPIEVKREGNMLIIEKEKATKNHKKLIRTSKAHIKNILSGLDKKYIYKMQVCAVHFPVTTSIQNNELIIKNFLGEIKERRAKLLPGAEVKIQKDIITIESANKEVAGQIASNIEKATRITKRDRRIFQDGIFIIEKSKGATRT